MKCRDFHEIIDSYLSDELLTETNHGVLRHLENCNDCRNVIEARRAVRQHLKSAVINSPEYQIGKDFSGNLRTQLKYEALNKQRSESSLFVGFGSWAAIAAGLMLVFTVGFILYSNSGLSIERPSVAGKQTPPHLTKEFAANHPINVVFGDHQFCAVKGNPNEPVKLANTPSKYAKIEQIALPILKKAVTDSNLKKSHTCEYKGTKFTHLVVEKEDEILSLIVTDRQKAEIIGQDIAHHSSEKYEMARFDVHESAVFVVSEFDQQMNSKVASALYTPLRKHLRKEDNLQTALLMFY